jgi:hypothetical protein
MAELDKQGETILRSLKEQYPSLTIAFTNGAICVWMPGVWTAVAYKENGAWVINDHVRKNLPNYVIFKELEASLLADASNRGAYILVNDETSKFLHETHDSAWHGRTNEHAFIGRIGTDDSSGEILALGAVEKPEKFDNLADR